MEAIGLDFEKLKVMVEREMLSASLLMRVLLYYSSQDRSQLAALISSVTRQNLIQVHDVLSVYPATDVGWSALPASREPFFKSEYSRDEQADIEQLQCQEDRAAVEYLRDLVRSQLNKSP